MSVPIVPMLSLASGILSVLNKALDKSQGQGFEDLLAGMTESSKGAVSALLAGLTDKLKGQEVKGADLLASTQAGTMILQFMAVLKQAGLGASEIQALMTGTGAEMSNEALKQILVSVGLPETQIQALMSDKALMAELKDGIVKNIQAAVGTDACEKMARSVKKAEYPTTDATTGAESTGDTFLTTPVDHHAAHVPGVPQMVSAAVQELVKAATQDDDTLTAIVKDIESQSMTASATDLKDLKAALAGATAAALKGLAA